jgi:apoptosis-inducing factor 3
LEQGNSANSLHRTKLSKALITDSTKLELRTAADLRIKYGVTVRTGVVSTIRSHLNTRVSYRPADTQTVTSVDVEGKKIVLDSGKETVGYDKLVLASGGTPRRLPVEGATLENVYTFRGIEDAKKVDTGSMPFPCPMYLDNRSEDRHCSAAQEGKRVVVIGSSFISMEVVGTIASRKLASIDVIGMEEYPFEAVLGKEIGKGLKKVGLSFDGISLVRTHHMQHYEEQGIKFHMQSKVEKIVPAEGNSALAGGVIVNGELIPADFVIMGVGVTPATEFLKGSGIQLERDGGVKVDQYLRVEGVKDVYAVGEPAPCGDTIQEANKSRKRR